MNLPSRAEQIDYDYIPMLLAQSKLKGPENADKRKEAKDALRLLNDFTEGYINADFRKESVKKLFEGKEHIRKEAYRRNNYRNQDILSRAKTRNSTISYEDWLGNCDENELSYNVDDDAYLELSKDVNDSED